MDKNAFISYWIESANRDYQTMLNLYQSKDYHWSLFIGHLVIEKLIKATYVKNINENPPRTHDLVRLAEKAGIATTEEQKIHLISLQHSISKFDIQIMNFFSIGNVITTLPRRILKKSMRSGYGFYR